MTKKKSRKGLLPNIEIIIIAVFFISFIFIMIPRCESNIEQEAVESTPTTATIDTPETENYAIPPPPQPEESGTASRIIESRASLKLYVTIDGINMRKDPNIVSRILKKLALFEEVYYQGETTEKKKEIDWGGGIVTNEPWVKIETENGLIGWVYGAGVHFYPRAFELPEEEE
ncbi:MAG: SH3 domain-containing protein [Bacteroidota bacterium]